MISWTGIHGTFFCKRAAGLAVCLLLTKSISAQEQSVARKWNEALLFSIQNDLARPTVHARNLFHVSAAMYDAWAIYDEVAEPYLIGKTVHGFSSPFNGISVPSDVELAREEALSYAAYRMLRHRFVNSPGAAESYQYYDSLMNVLGYEVSVTSMDYASGSAAHLGNYIADRYIQYGHQDGANEQLGYASTYYEPYNNPLFPQNPGNPDCIDANRWQPLSLTAFVDQSGNPIPGGMPAFLSPEWGNVWPFSLTDDDMVTHQRDGFDWNVYHDPGSPYLLDTANVDAIGELYQWSFALVSIWQSHLDTADGVMWDISPASIGNIQTYPVSSNDYPDFYDLAEGGDPGMGRDMNPKTGQPYAPQWVRRGDYARVLAEFWADGPNSYTPPGHWFHILNHVSDHPQFEKRYNGQGDVLDDLQWDVKSYFTLGGGMHDAAISAWSIKGYYDYIRPVSAIRYMADLGQSTDTQHPSYHPAGIPLIPGFIEIVEEDDPLVGDSLELIGKIKLNSWRGHDFVEDAEVNMAGAGWILAEHWWPYQRPSFVTPPFAGYVSGHSTFSRTAAEIMTLLTGDAYFPGGMSGFVAEKNEFLEFEQGPSTDVILQWATYRDASDQCSLSRIWGGIHPPMDDIPGRFIGMEIGPEAFEQARLLFETPITGGTEIQKDICLYPNPAVHQVNVACSGMSGDVVFKVLDMSGRELLSQRERLYGSNQLVRLNVSGLQQGSYLLHVFDFKERVIAKFTVVGG